jgi:hypothetical protein
VSNNKPRNQHYISQGWQLNFCDSKGKVCIYDMQRKKWFASNPNKQFCEKDFQSLFNREGLDPYILEKEFDKQIESYAIKVVKDIIKSKKLPNEEQFSFVLNLMGLFGARNAVIKRLLLQIRQREVIRFMHWLIEDKSRYAALTQKMTDGNINLCYEEAEKFVLEEKFKIEIDPDEIIIDMIEEAAKLIDWLGERNYWLVVEAANSEFLYSDCPLSIINLKNFNVYSPTDSIVIFPLSSHIALIGSFHRVPYYRLIEENIVDGINYCTAFYTGATKIGASTELSLPLKENLVALQQFYHAIMEEY